MEQLKIKDLYEVLKEEMAKGNGDKYVITGDDNEGNGYHGMYFKATPAEELDGELIYDSQEKDLSKIICIG